MVNNYAINVTYLRQLMISFYNQSMKDLRDVSHVLSKEWKINSQYYNPITTQCETCESKFPNCAACTNSTCQICQQHFYWNPTAINPKTGLATGMCKLNVCPAGYCRDSARKMCVLSTLSNCITCQGTTDVQECTLCKAGYLPTFDTQGNSICKLLALEKTINYYVKSGAPLQLSSYTYNTTLNDGKTPAKAFLFIQEAINALNSYQAVNFYQKVIATIYLGEGDHFFLQCDGDETSITFNTADHKDYVDYCSKINLKKSIVMSDNIHFTIKPLSCNDAKSLGMTNNADFLLMCISNFNYQQRPKVYVNHKNNYFNITGSATFENIIFSGINAFAQPATQTQDYSIFPILLCDLEYGAQLGDKPLSFLKQNQNIATNLKYSCNDVWYDKSNIPRNVTSSPRCLANDNQQFYQKKQSTLGCSNDIESTNFFWQNSGDQVYSKRRQTLFNLYAFPDHLTTYQSPPKLTINNCDFEYFLGGYSNLINIEYNNIMRLNKQNPITLFNETRLVDMSFFTYQGGQRGALILISNSNFKHSRFCLGLITYRKQLKISQYKSFINYTDHQVGNKMLYGDQGSYIILQNSTFNNLNFLTNVTAFAIYDGETPIKSYTGTNSLEAITYKAFIHKGIVLNLEDFNGTIEIAQSKFTNNMHFIPEILVMPYSSNLVRDADHFKDTFFTNEYKVSICNTDEGEDEYLFHNGISKNDNFYSYFERFERLGLIYVSRPSQPVIITNSIFLNNIGTFGAAITINSPNWIKGYQPYIYIKGNTFTGNMAYLQGNAIFIRNTFIIANQSSICAGVHIEDSQFYQNIGMKNHNGGAVSGVCYYITATSHDDLQSLSSITNNLTLNDTQNNITANFSSVINPDNLFIVYAFQFSILNCIFKENYSGQRGTAVFMALVSKIRIVGTIFEKNGPVYGYIETYNSPYSKYFSGRPLSFTDPEVNGCYEEFGYINFCSNVDKQIDWPSVRGALNVLGCSETWCLNANNTQILLLYNSSFINNQAGPYLDINTRNDLASSLYITGGYVNNITNTTFVNHSGSELGFLKILAPKLAKFFPDIYFDYAQAPVVRIRVQPKPITGSQVLNFSTNFDNCTFSGNKHMQILGLNFEKQYYGSLITMETFYLNGDLSAPQILIQNSQIRDNQFRGNETSLIYLFKGLLSVVNTTSYGNGYLTKEVDFKQTLIGDEYFPFDSYKYQKFQKYGLFYLSGMEAFPTGYYHKFINNSFSYSFAYQGAVYSLRLDGQFALFERNKYKFNFCTFEGGVAFARNQDGRSTFIFKEEDVSYTFCETFGAFALEPHDGDFLSIFFYNSTFRNNKAFDGSSMYLDSLAAFEARNISYSQDAWHSNQTAYIVSQFKKANIDIKDFINYQYLYYLTDQLVRKSGQVFVKKQVNTKDVYFLTQLIKKASDPYTQYAEFIDCRFFNLTSSHGAGIMAEEEQSVRVIATKYDPKTVITNNTVTEFGVFYAIIATDFVAQNLVFENNTALVRGSAIGASVTQVEVINCTFIGNRALSKATIYINEDTEFLCDQCYFYSNYAKESSTIFALNVQSKIITVQNSIFKQNYHDSNLINFILSHGYFKNTQFIDNFANKVNHGITLIDSTVTVENVTVNYTQKEFLWANTYEVDAGFFSLNFQSQLDITNSLFQNCRGAQGSVIYATGYSSVTVDGNTTLKNCASLQGSSLYFTMTNKVRILNTNFNNNTQNDIILENADAEINNCTFSIGYQQFIKASEANVIVRDSLFQNGINQDSNGKGIYCSCQNLTIINTTFKNLTALEGGALWLSSTYSKSYFNITNSTFIQNQAMHGGAIKIQDAAKLIFQDNKFINNRAERLLVDTSKSAKLVDKGLGGAINMDCFNEAAKLNNICQINFTKSNVFQNNSAEHDGGAIIWTGNRFQYDPTTKFIDNKAQYGANIANYAKSLMIQFINNNDPIFPMSNNTKFYRSDQMIQSIDDTQSTVRRLLKEINSGKRLENLYKFDIAKGLGRNMQSTKTGQNILDFKGIVSGMGFSFIVYILDQDDNLYTSDTSSVAILKSLTEDVVVQNFEANAKFGVYNFPNVIVNLEPGINAQLELEIEDMITYANSVSFIKEPFKINILTRPCQVGEKYTIDKSCIVCPTGEYLYQAPKSIVTCQKCDPNAICYGLYKVAPKPGYWRSSNTSTNFIKCPNSFACLGGNEYDPIGNCSEGFKGVMCGNCMPGFKKASDFKCTICPSQGANAVQFTGLIIFAILVCSFLVRSTINSADKEKPLYTVYMKIMTNHFQMVSAISSIDFNWPKEIEDLQSGQSSVSNFSDSLFSFDCFLQQSGNPDDSDTLYLQKLIFFALMPLILAIFSVAFWVILGLIKRNVTQIRDKLISTMVILLFLVHPTIAKILFQAFNCIEVDGINRLKSNIDMVCYKDQHMIYLFVVVIPGIIIWVIGIPLASLVMLLRNREKIMRVGKYDELSQSDKYQIIHLKMKYGFFFNGYKLGTFFWEVIILYRKISIVMVSVFFSVVSAEAQVLVVILIIVVSLLLQIKYKPFYTDELNKMELFSLQVAVITMYGGMFYVTGKHYSYMGNNGLKWFLLLFILGPNILFFGYWLHYMRIEILKLVYQKNARLFKLLSCNMYKDNSFQERYMSNQEEKIKSDRQEYQNNDKDLKRKQTKNEDATEKTFQLDHDKTDFSNIEFLTKHDKDFDNSYLPRHTSTSEKQGYKYKKQGMFHSHKPTQDPKLNGININESFVDPAAQLSEIKLDFPLHMMKKVPDTYLRGSDQYFQGHQEDQSPQYDYSNNHRQPQSITQGKKVSKLNFPASMFGGLKSQRDNPKSSRRVMPESLANKISARKKSSRFFNDIVLDSGDDNKKAEESGIIGYKPYFDSVDNRNHQRSNSVRKHDRFKESEIDDDVLRTNANSLGDGENFVSQRSRKNNKPTTGIFEYELKGGKEQFSQKKKIIDHEVLSENNAYPFEYQNSASKMLDPEDLLKDYSGLQSDAGNDQIGLGLSPIQGKRGIKISEKKKSGRLWRQDNDDFDNQINLHQRLDSESIVLPSIVDQQQNLSDNNDQLASTQQIGIVHPYDLFGNPVYAPDAQNSKQKSKIQRIQPNTVRQDINKNSYADFNNNPFLFNNNDNSSLSPEQELKEKFERLKQQQDKKEKQSLEKQQRGFMFHQMDNMAQLAMQNQHSSGPNSRRDFGSGPIIAINEVDGGNASESERKRSKNRNKKKNSRSKKRKN
eukprot:403331176